MKELGLVHKLNDAGGVVFDNKGVFKTERRSAVVLSQCCEFNPGKRTGFSIAALLPLTDKDSPIISRSWGFLLAELASILRSPFAQEFKKFPAETVETLRQANDYRTGKIVNSYLFDQHGDDLPEPHLADFTHVVSIRMTDHLTLTRHKVLQLTQSARRQFQLKLGMFYAREAD